MGWVGTIQAHCVLFVWVSSVTCLCVPVQANARLLPQPTAQLVQKA
jgi:hypothetical protein